MATGAFDSLPVELCLDIIDMVVKDAPDPNGLKKYATISKIFKDPCQRRALSRIKLGGETDFNSLCNHIKTYYSNRQVRETPLRHVTSIRYQQGIFDEMDQEVAPYLRYLIKLNELHLTGVRLKNICAFGILGSTVCILSVAYSRMDDIDDLLNLLRSFTKLRHLTINLPDFTRLKSLHASTPATSKPQYPTLPLRDLRLTSTSQWYNSQCLGEELGRFFSHSGAMLTTVEIHWSWGVFDLSSMVNLKRVKLHVPSVPTCIRILRTIPAETLAILHLNFLDTRNPHNHPWGELDDMLRALHHPMNNRQLKFRVDGFLEAVTLLQNFIQNPAVAIDSEPFPTFVGS